MKKISIILLLLASASYSLAADNTSVINNNTPVVEPQQAQTITPADNNNQDEPVDPASANASTPVKDANSNDPAIENNSNAATNATPNTTQNTNSDEAANQNENNETKDSDIAKAPVNNTANASPIDCNVKIPSSTQNIETNFLLEWAKSAITQSFSFSPEKIDDELGALKACYTDQGWQGFQDALKKSGNLIAIKTQKFDVSSNITNTPEIQTVHNNQWKVSLNMDVVYQNSKEKLTQNLNVIILIGRKMTGDLGIMQVVATPKSKNN